MAWNGDDSDGGEETRVVLSVVAATATMMARPTVMTRCVGNTDRDGGGDNIFLILQLLLLL